MFWDYYDEEEIKENEDEEDDDEKVVEVKPYGDGTGVKIDVYSNDPKYNKDHDSIHLKINYEERSFSVVTKFNGKKDSGDGKCYLTTACMRHYLKDFDDNCYELTVLKWCRDNFVSKEDIKHYYQIAPIIVRNINNDINADLVYDYIYDNVVDHCV